MTVFALRLHASYRCRHSGVCCTEGWDIPIDAPLHALLAGAIGTGTLDVGGAAASALLVPAAGLPHGEPFVAARAGCQCAFFEPDRGRLCAIQRQLGHSSLPSQCQHFPRVVALDPRGVFVSLSHLCPTAGGLLFADCESPFDLVSTGELLTPDLRWEGLDARDALPPQVSDAVLWDWDALSAWERRVLGALDRQSPERALEAVSRAAVRLERWHPSRGATLAHAVEVEIDEALGAEATRELDIDGLDSRVRNAAGSRADRELPNGRAEIDRELVAPGWPTVQRAVSRFLAARAVANWTGYHTRSATAWARSLDAAYAVLRTECAWQCAAAGRVLDAALVTAAAADADRLLVHRLDAAKLAHALKQAT